MITLWRYMSIVYQTVPTFRVQIPGNLSVGEFHTDKDYNHGEEEINWWIPVTRAYGTNTVWIESEPNKKDYQPYELGPGQALIFSGANLSHGNKVNDTPHTRVSLDFRVVPARDFKSRDTESMIRKLKMDIGGYFAVCE